MRGEEDTATSSEMRLDSGASTRTTVTAVAQPVFTCHSTCTGRVDQLSQHLYRRGDHLSPHSHDSVEESARVLTPSDGH